MRRTAHSMLKHHLMFAMQESQMCKCANNSSMKLALFCAMCVPLDFWVREILECTIQYIIKKIYNNTFRGAATCLVVDFCNTLPVTHQTRKSWCQCMVYKLLPLTLSIPGFDVRDLSVSSLDLAHVSFIIIIEY